METHDVGEDRGGSIVGSGDGVKVLDVAETITSQLEVVGADSSSSVSEIEGLLALEGLTSICIWDSLRYLLA